MDGKIADRKGNNNNTTPTLLIIIITNNNNTNANTNTNTYTSKDMSTLVLWVEVKGPAIPVRSKSPFGISYN